MSLDHQLSDRVYRSLKDDVIGGVLGCGRLNLASLEARYASSATPVREGLLRLVGEKLVDLLPQGGFGIHGVDEVELRNLYELNLRLLGLVANWRSKGAPKLATDPTTSSSLCPPVDVLFLSMSAALRNQALTDIMAAINDRLHCVRTIEHKLLADTIEEFDALVRLANGEKWRSFRNALRAYHRRRIKFARAIANR